MSILLFLNELSCGTPQPRTHVDEAMDRFVGLLRRIRQWRSDAALVTSVKREYLELAQGYYVNQWIASKPRHADLWRVIRSMQNRAPFSAVLPPGAGEGAEYSWNGSTAKALGAAHLMDGLLVSLLVDAIWDRFWLQASCEELIESADGEPEIVKDSVQVRHAAKQEHVESHEEWIKESGLSTFRHGSEIWEACGDLYPNLQFLSGVKDQLYDLRPDWVVTVAYQLRKLDDAIGEWDPKLKRQPSWRTEVTPEAEQRKHLYCGFVDLDGAERFFDLHSRFRPGQGRIHFRLVPERRKATIAYIGLKLGI